MGSCGRENSVAVQKHEHGRLGSPCRAYFHPRDSDVYLKKLVQSSVRPRYVFTTILALPRFMLDTDTVMDHATMTSILTSGRSRVRTCP